MTQLLLIEDDAAVATSLQDGLARNGYDVVWRSRGTDGLQYAQAANPHLILLDVRLPDGSGFDFCRWMRQSGVRQPIIMLTVQRDEIDKVLGLEMGADDYVTKPFGLRELLARIRAQLRRAYGELSSVEANQLRAGDIVIDLARAEAWREDDPVGGRQPLALTPIELKLLVFLARHPGEALSRAQILDGVWGYETDVESERLINVNIRRLRGKVELDPSHPTLILTVPGIGYRLAR
jgi:DNA-binding response OmpR family regulator